MKMILCINKICFYSETYKTLFDLVIYSKNAAHKYISCIANNSTETYFT